VAAPEGNRPHPIAVEGSTAPDAISVATKDALSTQQLGAWSYYAGASGTVNVAANQRVIGILTHSTNGGSFTVAGGPSIPVPANVTIDINPLGNLTGPTIVFTGTDTYLVEVVQ
jgi:hypothetical protein